MTNNALPPEPAFPATHEHIPGLTKREYIATAAMTSFAVGSNMTDERMVVVAKQAVKLADMLLKELEA